MQKLASITAVIAALGIAAYAFSGRNGGGTATSNDDKRPSSSHLPSKTERIDNDHAPERFDSLNDEMKALALELETAAIKWNRNRSADDGIYREWNEWRKYSTDRISALSTAQIRQLGEWMDSDPAFISELHSYRQALIRIWSSREPEVVRARLMETAENSGFVGKEVNGWRNGRLDELAEDFHQARVGYSMKDPKAAWKQLLQDDADPRMKYLTNAGTTLPELFREYSARLPEEAWNLALATGNEEYCLRMIEGFADGAPAGQDWEERGRELTHSLTARGLKASHWPFQSIGERWMMEDPIAALDWYVRSAPEEGLARAYDRLNRDSSDDPFAEALADDPFKEEPPSDPDEISNLLKTDLLVGMYGSHKDRSREALAALDHLATHGEEQLAAAVAGELVGTRFDPMDIPLLEVIARMPKREDRNALFLQAVHAIHVRDDDPFATLSDALERPNACLVAARDLASRLDLPEAIRAEAEAVFRDVENKELKALEVLEKQRRDKNDPFSSR